MTVRRVLVTRPAVDAARTAGRLAERGFEPVVLPLTEIVPLGVEAWPAPDSVAAVALASANAARHAPPALLAAIGHLPTFAVGEKTGEAAGAAGLKVVEAQAGDAAELVRRIAGAIPPGAGVLLLCGRVRRDTLEKGLVQAGFGVSVVETYDTRALSPSESEVRAAVGEKPVDAVLLHSALAAETFGRIAGCGPFAAATYFVMSERVAEMLPETVGGRLHIAPKPTEEAMLSLLST